MALAWNAGWVNALAGSNRILRQQGSDRSSDHNPENRSFEGDGARRRNTVHLTLSAVAGVLYFLFVLPRWWG